MITDTPRSAKISGKRLFGTDGIRGVAGKDLTADLAYSVGRAAALLAAGDAEKPKIIIGRDTRTSGEMLESAVIEGALAAGADIVKLGIIPTPAVAFLTRHLKADAGIVISASHNPVDDNGIKLFDGNGFKLSPDQERIIEILVKSEIIVENETARGRVTDYAGPGAAAYIEHLVKALPVSLSGIKVVLDCCYGAAYKIAGDAFRAAGATVREINNEPRGEMINVDCGSTNPARAGIEAAAKEGYFGLAFDGDADRVIAVDEDGGICDGDFLIAIIAAYLKARGSLVKNTVVGTVMANLGFDLAMRDADIEVIKADVGDRYVLALMRDRGLNFGGEQSGHIILLDHTTTGDGILTGLMVAAILAETGKPLRELKRIMEKMPQVLINIRVDDKDCLSDAKAVWDTAGRREAEMNGRGRILIRPSGTEPLVRVMVEAETQELADEVAAELAGLVQNELGGK